MADEASTTTQVPPSGVDRYFKITERGSTVSREIARPGVVTFFTMAYIVVLNPHPLLWATAVLFVIYFMIDPIEQLLG